MRKALIMAAMLSTAAFGMEAYTTTPSSDLRVWPEFPTIIADGKTVNYVKVYQHDDQDLVYSAFNMEFILPEGFRVNTVKEGRNMVDDIKLTERADATHSISCNLMDGYDLRIIAYSSKNADLYQDDEEGNPLDHLFTVGLIAEPTLTGGEHTMQLDGVKFVMKNGDATVPAVEPATFTFYVQPTMTGVEDVAVEEEETEYYDLQGHKVNPENAHGRIVVSSKGAKVLVK